MKLILVDMIQTLQWPHFFSPFSPLSQGNMAEEQYSFLYTFQPLCGMNAPCSFLQPKNVTTTDVVK